MSQDSLLRAIPRFLPKWAYGIACSGYLFTVGVTNARHRNFIVDLCRYFGWKDALPPAELPTVDPKVLINDADVKVVDPQPVEGNVSLIEMLVINALVRRNDVRRALEIGTFDGRTTLNIAANMRDGGEVYTLDLPQSEIDNTAHEVATGDRYFINKESSGARFQGHPLGSRITQLYGDSGTFDFAPWAGSIGLIFVDGSHAYEYVLSDSERAMEMIGEKGVILWHDYDSSWEGVTRGLNELRQRDPRFAGIVHIAGTALAMLEIP